MKLESLTPYTNRQATPIGFFRSDWSYVIVAEAHGHGHVELAEKLSKAYNEHAALIAVAEAAQRRYFSTDSREWETLELATGQALANLAAVRAGSEVAK